MLIWIRSVFLTLIFSLLLLSCGKDEDSTSSPKTLEGRWDVQSFTNTEYDANGKVTSSNFHDATKENQYDIYYGSGKYEGYDAGSVYISGSYTQTANTIILSVTDNNGKPVSVSFQIQELTATTLRTRQEETKATGKEVTEATLKKH